MWVPVIEQVKQHYVFPSRTTSLICFPLDSSRLSAWKGIVMMHWERKSCLAHGGEQKQNPNSIIRLEMRKIWLEVRDVVLSGDTGSRYRYSLLWLEGGTSSQRDWLLCCQVPKKLHRCVFRAVSSRAHSPNFMLFLLTALCPVTPPPVPIQSELIKIMWFKDTPSPSYLHWPDWKDPGDPFIFRVETG